MPPMPASPSLDLRVAGAINRGQLRNLSVIQGVQSVVPIPLYDTLSVANGNTLTTLQFFANTRGGQGLYVTNMEASSQLISGKVQIVTEVQCDVGQAAANATALADAILGTCVNAAFVLYINNVEYAEGQVKQLIGLGLYAPTVTANTYVASRCGAGQGFQLNPAIVIPTQTQFNVNFLYAAAFNPTATTILRVFLLGQQVRLMSS